MQKMTTALREQGGLKRKPEGLKYRKHYIKKYDVELLKNISRQEHGRLVSQLALRVARSLERERQRTGVAMNARNPKIEINEILPHNELAEIALLENLLFRPAKVGLAISIVSPKDIYSRLRANVYQRIIEFHESGRAWNGVTLEDSFKSNEHHLKYRDFFDELLPWTGETVGHNARIIKEYSDQRKLIAATYQANNDLFNAIGVDAVRATLEQVLEEVAQ